MPSGTIRHRGFARALLTLATILIPSFSVAYGAELSIAEARKGVVFIRSQAPGFPTMEGSGFLVSEDGLVYTNRHVIAAGDVARGQLIVVGVPSAKDPDELDYFRAAVVFATKEADPLDFAILKIKAKTEYGKFHTLPLANTKPELGASVAVIGYPRVENNHPVLSLNKGSISATKRKLDGKLFCQTDAAVNPGNSGGPLLNQSGEVIGIVTAKKMDAENIGFALYVSEVTEVAARATTPERLSAATPDAGPLDPAKLPQPSGIKPTAENWEIGAGRMKAGKAALLLENSGGEYWIVSKNELPENFQLDVPCVVAFLQGRQHIQPSQRTILRTVAIRFGSDDVKTEILERKGYLLKFSHAGIWLFKEGAKDECVAHEWTGNSDQPMMLTITCNHGDVTIAVDQQKLLEFHDADPIKGRHKVCIGGYLSELAIGEVSALDLDADGRPSAATKPSSGSGSPRERRTGAPVSTEK